MKIGIREMNADVWIHERWTEKQDGDRGGWMSNGSNFEADGERDGGREREGEVGKSVTDGERQRGSTCRT